MLRYTFAGLTFSLLWGHAQAQVEAIEQAIAQQDYRGAMQMLDARADAWNAQDYLLRGLALEGLNRLDEAKDVYLGLISRRPHHPEAYNNLAGLYARQGMLEEAREWLEQAMQTHPSYATVYDNLTRVTMEMSRSSYARALRLQGQDGTMRLARLQQVAPTSQAEIHLAQAEQPVPLSLAQAEPRAEVAETITRQEQPRPPQPTAAERDLPLASDEPVLEPVALSAPEPVLAQQEPPVAATATDAHVPASAEPVVTPKHLLEKALLRWAAAWSAQDVEGYLAAYSDRFVPTDNLNLRQWRAQRRDRLSRPSHIQVDLSEMDILIFDEHHARVRLTQAYNADHYSDVTRKEFQLVWENDGWLIRSERSLEVVSR